MEENLDTQIGKGSTLAGTDWRESFLIDLMQTGRAGWRWLSASDAVYMCPVLL
jgi:hypothetical protein